MIMFMQEYFCTKCKQKLISCGKNGRVEISCYKCRMSHSVKEGVLSIGSVNNYFEEDCIRHQCDKCGKVLVKTDEGVEFKVICVCQAEKDINSKSYKEKINTAQTCSKNMKTLTPTQI